MTRITPYPQSPTVVAERAVADGMQQSIQSGTPGVPLVDDDPNVRPEVNGISSLERANSISSLERAFKTTEPLRQLEDNMDARPDTIHSLLASAEVQLALLTRRANELECEDIWLDVSAINAAIGMGYRAAVDTEKMISCAARIQNSVDFSAPDVAARAKTIISLADAMQRLLEASP